MLQFIKIDGYSFRVDDIDWVNEFTAEFTDTEKVRIHLKSGEDIVLQDEQRKKFLLHFSQYVIVI